jgi:hypothetical protein
MTILKVAGVLFLFMIASLDALACSCETYGQPRKDAKEYYTKEFKGAIFTGTVESIEHDPAYEGGGITYSKLKIVVDQYWLGVLTPSMLIEVPGPNTSCWFGWKTGQEGFFIAEAFEGGLQYAGCDVANWKPSNSKATLEAYTAKILGKPMSFPKPK